MKCKGNMTTGEGKVGPEVSRRNESIANLNKSKRKQEFHSLAANHMFEKTVHYLDYRACTIVKD